MIVWMGANNQQNGEALTGTRLTHQCTFKSCRASIARSCNSATLARKQYSDSYGIPSRPGAGYFKIERIS